MIRGNYIRDNVKPASSYDEFLYKQPKNENEKPERVIPELDRSLSVENDSGISEVIPESDKKNAAVNSLTLHEKNNPRMSKLSRDYQVYFTCLVITYLYFRVQRIS